MTWVSRQRVAVAVLAATALLFGSYYVTTVEQIYRDENSKYPGNHGHYFRFKADNINMLTLEEVQVSRRHTIRKVCSYLIEHGMKAIHHRTLDHIIVDDKHKLLYCYVPKVACTNWKRIMMILTENSEKNPLDIPANNSHNHIFRTLDTFSKADVQYRLTNYLKFLFVRHPFERLVSAFRNKFEQNYSTYFHQHFGRVIVQRYRTTPSARSLQFGRDVAFTEFVNYLLDPETKMKEGELNEHWRPAFDLCHPCHVHYDIIGKYESLEEDAEYVLDRANVGHYISFPKSEKPVKTADLVNLYFANLSVYQSEKLFQLYSLDFKLFDYDKSIINV